MVEHTPGPWAVSTVHGIVRVVGHDPEEPRCPWIVADVTNGASYDENADPVEANAHLLAAAPDLLAACEAILTRLDYLSNLWGQEGVTRSLMDQVRAAIARAKPQT